MSEQIESEAFVRRHMIESLDYYVNMFNSSKKPWSRRVEAVKFPEGIRVVNHIIGRNVAFVVISGMGCVVKIDDSDIVKELKFDTFYDGIMNIVEYFFSDKLVR